VAIQDEITQDEHVQLRFQELDALEEGRLHALQNLELYRQNMVRAYDMLVKQRVFQKGEMVLMLRRPIFVMHKTMGKFEPKWEGPYVIEQVYDGGAYQLIDSQGVRPMPQSTEGSSKNTFLKILPLLLPFGFSLGKLFCGLSDP